MCSFCPRGCAVVARAHEPSNPGLVKNGPSDARCGGIRPGACGCRISRHPTRPGNILGSGLRDGHGGGPGHLRLDRVDADARQARAVAAPDVAGARCNDRRTRQGPAAGAARR